MKTLNGGIMNELKVQPQDLSAEQALLGGILNYPKYIPAVNYAVLPNDFYREAHQHICRAIFDLVDNDLVRLSQWLDKRDLLEKVGGNEYIAQLVQGVSTGAGWKHHAKIIKDLSVKRQIIVSCAEISESCHSGNETDEIIDNLEKTATEIAKNTVVGEGFAGMPDVIKGSFKQIEAAAEIDGYITGLATGFTDFDELTAGLQPSDLIILAGRPSMGKTAFALNIAHNVAVDGGAVAVFSIEMAKTQLGIRMIGTDARVNASKLRAGNLQDSDWQKVAESASTLTDLPIFIDDNPSSVLHMKSKCRKLQREHNLELIIIDYLQLMESRKGSESRQIAIADISRSLKAMAKELNVPIMALSQLNRKVEDRQDKHPKLSDIRESGAIEQDADLIAFIYRDEVYHKTTEKNRNIADIIVAKHRNGPTGHFRLTFLKEFTRFEDHAYSDDEDFSYRDYTEARGFDG